VKSLFFRTSQTKSHAGGTVYLFSKEEDARGTLKNCRKTKQDSNIPWMTAMALQVQASYFRRGKQDAAW